MRGEGGGAESRVVRGGWYLRLLGLSAAGKRARAACKHAGSELGEGDKKQGRGLDKGLAQSGECGKQAYSWGSSRGDYFQGGTKLNARTTLT